MGRRDSIIKKVFIETPVFDDKSKDKFHDTEINLHKGTFQRTEKINATLEADIYDVKEEKYYKIKIRNNQDLIGIIELDYNTNKVVPFPRVIGIAVRHIYRGKGYSKTFYTWLINRFGGIFSDETLTGEEEHGSFQVWQWISKNFNTYIWLSKETAIFPIKGPITDKMMNKKKEHFLATKEPFDYHTYNQTFSRSVKVPSYANPEKKRDTVSLTEMPAVNDTHLKMGVKDKDRTTIDITDYVSSKQMGELLSSKNMGDFILELYLTQDSSAARYKSFALLKNSSEIAGRMSATDTGKYDFPVMDYIYIYDEFQGKGLGISLYRQFVDEVGGVISDATLTIGDKGGSFSVWQKLSKMYNAYFVSRDEETRKPIYNKVDQFTDDMLGDPNERFLVTVKPLEIENPNSAQLQSIKETPMFSDKNKELADDESFMPPLNATLKRTYGIDIPVDGKLGKGKIELYQFNSNPLSKEILLYAPNGESIGAMIYDDDKDSDLPFPTIDFSGIKEKYRGKGFSKILYDFVIKTYKGIISGYALTGEEGIGSFQIWQSLAKKYNIYKADSNTGVIMPIKNLSKADMGDSNERFMATLYPFDYERRNQGKKKIAESPELMDYKAVGDIDSSDPNEWDFFSGQKIIEKKIGPGLVFIKMKIAHSPDFKYAIKDIKNNKILCGMRAKIDSSTYMVTPTEAQIGSVVTNPEERGKGWGKLIYKLVLDTEKTLISDTQLYPGTFSIWKNYLPTIANVYNVNEDGDLEPFDPVKGTGYAGQYDYFVASKKKLL
jgi:GNAT superfamily N-acetyltransferase/predicted acetyltransferase